ncbi:hypothetical protein UC34_04505 [Pandoraea vervacti]|uniref:SET domain-containing protein-lysine N-methyltransferase n=1 Tax=Pandoraea vervacti TaxID=656178 RepID=A0ABM5SVE5_9BURK|nr:SET domain-containing protein-lysine N-methyltransferase [Pandoraea vervacti]AJP56464.1 hypothetical protein UC34_04505 [Pandoraea vervacti]
MGKDDSHLFELLKDGYPSRTKFEICRVGNGPHSGDGESEGECRGVRTLVAFRRAELVSQITGMLTSERKLHTLQVSEASHLYDPDFSGMLLHSCSPSTVLDMKHLKLFALRDIEAGEFLTIDYASTEEVLARQFKCQCGAPGCRKWITGFRELPNEEGMAYLMRSRAETQA